MNGVTFGDANLLSKDEIARGWFVGYFWNEGDLKRQAGVEVKWAILEPGETKGGFVANRTATTLAILIAGRVRLIFRRENEIQETVLDMPGMFAIWTPGIFHDWIAEQTHGSQTVVLAVRWPSLKDDQYQLGTLDESKS